MIRQELYKVFVKKSTVFFIAVLLILNMAQLVYIDKKANSWTFSAYTRAWRSMEKYAEDGTDRHCAMQEWLKERSDAALAAIALKDEAAKSAASVYTDNVYTETRLLARLEQEVGFALGYGEYLAGVDEAARRYEMLSVFSKSDSYAYRDIMKMQKLYGRIERKTLEPAPSAGVRLATHSDVTDILALVILLYLTVTVWLKEREQNMLLLLRTTRNGRIRLALCKLAVLAISCVGTGVLLYGINMLTAGVMYDFGDFSRPLASVYEYGHTLWEITVGEFMVLNVIIKILGYIFIMLLLSVICLCVQSSVAAFSGIIAAGAAGCLMYYKIPALSVWATFKYLNTFAVLKTEMLFEGYKGLNFFGYPIDYRQCIAVLFGAGFIVFSMLMVKLFTGCAVKNNRRLPKALGKVRRLAAGLRSCTGRHTSVLLHELHRIFVCQGVLAITVVAAVLIIADSRPGPVRYVNERAYYTALYLKQLEGPVTEEKLAFVEEEETRVRESSDDSKDARKDALRLVRERIGYLLENKGACFIYDAPHNMLVAEAGNGADFMRALYVMMLLVLCMPCFFAPDLQNGMYRIIGVTAKGRRKLKRMRYVLGTVLAAGFALLVHLPKFRQILLSYGVRREVMSYPAGSIPYLEKFGTDISVGMYYLLLLLLWIASAIMGAFLMHRLAWWIKSPAYTMLAGVVILMFPLLIALYSREIIYTAYPYSMFAGNLFLQDKNAALVCIAAWGAFFVAEILIQRHFNKA